MKIRAVWEFEVDTDWLDPTFIDIPGLAKDLTKRELADMLGKGQLTAEDFQYEEVTE